jgi:plastocyanin
MFEDLWNGILELTEKFVIPDWSSVVAMLPVLIFAASVVVIVATLWKLLRAPKARRGKQRIEPIPPPGVHMPGPSWAPVFAAIGAFMLFLGLVFGGAVLILGAIGFALTLLYWLAESLRLYDRDLGATAPSLPAVDHDGPPPGVHMPGPSFLPVLAAIGLAMLLLGLVFGEWLLAVGVIAFVLSLLGWMSAARQEFVKTEEADSTGHLETMPDPPTPKLLLTSLGLLLAAGFVIQVGWIPPRASGGEAAGPSGAPVEPGGPGEPGASPGEPGASPGASGGPPGEPVIHAKDVAFVESTITAPADVPFKLEFVNDDPGIQHNVEIKDGSGASVFKGEIFAGVATMVYDVPALGAGTYGYVCSVHPNMTGSATIQ